MNKVLPLLTMATALAACGQSQPSETVDYLVAHPERIKELQPLSRRWFLPSQTYGNPTN